MAQEKLLAPLKQSDCVRVKGRCVRVRTVDRFKRVIVTRAGKVVPFHLVKPGEFCQYFIKGFSKISLQYWHIWNMEKQCHYGIHGQSEVPECDVKGKNIIMKKQWIKHRFFPVDSKGQDICNFICNKCFNNFQQRIYNTLSSIILYLTVTLTILVRLSWIFNCTIDYYTGVNPTVRVDMPIYSIPVVHKCAKTPVYYSIHSLLHKASLDNYDLYKF